MSTRRAVWATVVIVMLVALFGAIGLAQPSSPPTRVNATLLAPGAEYVNYQGVLTDSAGTPLADGNYTVTFALYDAVDASEALWTETQTVTTADGLFNVQLGTVEELDLETTDGRDLWLGVKVGDDAEMTPRLPITSVFYARSLVPGAYIQGNLTNAAILSIYNDTFGNNGIGLRVESRRNDSIEAEGDIEVRRGDVEVLQGNVEAGQNVTADQDIVAGNNVNALNDVQAFRNVLAGNDVLADRDIRAGRHLVANADVAGGRLISGDDVEAVGDVLAGNDVLADRDIRADRHLVANADVAGGRLISGGDVEAINNVLAGEDVEAENNVLAGNSIFAEDVFATENFQANVDVLAGRDVNAGRDVTAGRDLIAGGTKPALVQTESFGRRFTYAIEGAQVWFVDQGQARLEKGVVTINLDPIFLETVTIDEQHPMLVHITLTSDSKGVYVAEKTATSFTVRELQGGTSNASFDWRVTALRKGYEDTRLEVFEDAEQTQ